MQMTGLHGTSSMKPELTQHHRQMACRTTPALTYLSHSTSLLLNVCHCSHHFLILSLSFSLSNSLYSSPSVALVHFPSLSSSPSICLPFLRSLLTYSLTKCPQLQGPRGAPVDHLANTNSTKLYQLKSNQTVMLLVQMRRCKVNQIVFLCLPFRTLSSRLQHN